MTINLINTDIVNTDITNSNIMNKHSKAKLNSGEVALVGSGPGDAEY